MCLRSFLLLLLLYLCTTHFCISIRVNAHTLHILCLISSLSLARLLQAIAFNSLHALADAMLYLDTYMHLTVALNNFHLWIYWNSTRDSVSNLCWNCWNLIYVAWISCVTKYSCKCWFHTSFTNIAEHVNIYTMWQ